MVLKTKNGRKLKTYEDFPFNDLMTYAGIDTIVTLELFKALWSRIIAKPEYRIVNDGDYETIKTPSVYSEALSIKKDAIQFMVDLTYNGLEYDVDLNRQYDKEMREQVNTLKEKVFAATGERWNTDSDVETQKVLFDKFKLTTSIRTKKGKESTSGDALIQMAKENPELPWLKDLVVLNDVAYVHRGFVETYIEKWVKKDGRVHPNYNLHGTSSHRISGDNPNLLNIPSPKHGYNLRRLFKVRPGYVFLTFDFSSCEVKILAALSQDPKMLEAILGGLDFHSYTAGLMYHIPYEEMVEAVEDDTHPNHKKYKNFRKNAKSVTFGLLFGSSPGGIARNIGCDNDEAQKIIDAYFLVYPKIKDFIAQCHREAEMNKYVYTQFGQRKMEYGLYQCFKGTAVYNAAKRNAQNVMIQSTASTLGLVVFSEFNKRIKKLGGMAICTVYDSIELEVPIDKIAEAVNLGFYLMDDWPQEQFPWLTFPIGSDCELGLNWGQLKKAHRGVTQRQCLELIRESKRE